MHADLQIGLTYYRSNQFVDIWRFFSGHIGPISKQSFKGLPRYQTKIALKLPPRTNGQKGRLQ